MTRAKRIAEQLGVSQGAANHRLRKSILYKYVRLAEDHFCYKCGSEIESVDDFSIEHKEPWEGRDTELFWSLDNIAFSHVQCNIPHTRGAVRREKDVHGRLRCGTCKEWKSLDNFHNVSTNYQGKANDCKICKSVRNKARKRN